MFVESNYFHQAILNQCSRALTNQGILQGKTPINLQYSSTFKPSVWSFNLERMLVDLTVLQNRIQAIFNNGRQLLSSKLIKSFVFVPLLATLKLQNSLIQQSCISQQNLKQAFQSWVFKLQSLNLRLELSILKRLSPSQSQPTVNFKQKSTQHKNFKLVLTSSSRSFSLKSLTRDFNFNLQAILSHDSQASQILKLRSSNSLKFQTEL